MGRNLFSEKLEDLRFREIENRIFRAYFIEGLRSSTEIARYAGVSRSTVFRHHQTVFEIKSDYFDYILYRFKVEVCGQEMVQDFRQLVFRIIAFVIHYQKMFEGLFQEGAEELIVKMMRVVKCYVERNYGYLEDERLYKMFSYEVYVILEEWAENGFSDEEIGIIFNRMIILAKDKHRLIDLK